MLFVQLGNITHTASGLTCFLDGKQLNEDQIAVRSVMSQPFNAHVLNLDYI